MIIEQISTLKMTKKYYYQKGIIECGCGSGLVQECQCATCRSAPYPKFPAPMPMGGVNVTMLPFICGREFQDYKLPGYVKQYEDLIKFCLQHQMKHLIKISVQRWVVNSLKHCTNILCELHQNDARMVMPE